MTYNEVLYIMKKFFYNSLSVILCVVLLFCLVACTNINEEKQSTDNGYSYKSQMDIAMQHISNPKVLATVNGIEITEVDLDLFSISGENYDIEDIVKYYVITDYAEKNSLEMDDWCQELYDEIEDSMMEDKELSDDYCITTYGIPKSEVIKYAKKRVYLIGMNAAFFDMVTEDVSIGETPNKHPELKKAYDKFEKNRLRKGSKAWDDIEEAYYEMIVKDYDIVIY